MTDVGYTGGAETPGQLDKLTLAGSGLLKKMRWWDGFVLALAIPAAVFFTLGFTLAAIGALAAMALWAISTLMGTLQNWLFAETASMFPTKPGGISLYANEGWRRYCTLVGPLAAFGYWFGWSIVLAISGLTAGDILQAEWFPTATWGFWDGAVHVGLPQCFAIALLLMVWLLNVFGIRPALWWSYVSGALLVAVLVVVVITPLTSQWHSFHLTWGLGGPGADVWGGWKNAIVWLYVIGWTVYGCEVSASFAPEYKSRRDVTRAIKSSSLFTLGVFLLAPYGFGGMLSQKQISAEPVTFWVTIFNNLIGRLGSEIVVVIVLCSVALGMSTATADGSRALFGIARDGMTIKQLHHLNKRQVPGRAMTVDLVVNVALVLFAASPLAILLTGNLGYMLSVFFAITGFLLLRKDRPRWPRPMKLSKVWIPMAMLLAVVNLVLIAVGASSPALTGYGTAVDVYIGLGVLASSLLLYVFRRVVQERKRFAFREATPEVPEEGSLEERELALAVAERNRKLVGMDSTS